MNMFKKNGGFTLVELIVVIAILAILAAVAVPAYSGYIAKAEDAAVVQTLGTINTAAQGLAAAEGAKVESIVVTNANAANENATAASISVVVNTDKDKTEGSTTTYVVTQAAIESLTQELDDMFEADFKGAAMYDNEWDTTTTTVPTEAPAESEGE